MRRLGLQPLEFWIMAVMTHAGASVALGQLLEGAVWPQFRGVNASGVVETASLPVEFSPDKNVIWSVGLPRGVSSPCIWGDRVFLTAFQQETQSLQTLCVDRTNGTILWRKSAPTEKIEDVHEVSSPANATPAADEQRVYVYFASYGLLCYDHQGNLVWEHALPMPQGRFGSGTSPVLINELLILNHDLMTPEATGDSYLLALNCRTGETVWKAKHDASDTAYSTPVHWHDSGKDRVLLLSLGRLTAYNLTNGEELWSVSELPIQTVPTPVIGDGRLYFCATGALGEHENAAELPAFEEMVTKFDKNSDGLRLDEISDDMLLINRRMSRSAGNSTLKEFIGYADTDSDQEISEEEWNTFVEQARNFIAQSTQGVYAIRLTDEDGEDGRRLWVDPKGVPEIPSLLFLDGRVYSVKNGGIFYCRDAATGKQVYVGRLRATGGYFASPVCGDGKIYTASDRGQVSVIEVGDRLKILATNDFGEPIAASPALVDGTIYIRTDTRLYACGAD